MPGRRKAESHLPKGNPLEARGRQIPLGLVLRNPRRAPEVRLPNTSHTLLPRRVEFAGPFFLRWERKLAQGVGYHPVGIRKGFTFCQ